MRVTTLAGNGDAGDIDGTGGQDGTTEFWKPQGVAVDPTGNVYVADSRNNRIRLIRPGGDTATLAGNGDAGFADGTSGPNGSAMFSGPSGVAVDAAGNVYVVDSGNNRIRKIVIDGGIVTVAGNGVAGFSDGTGGPNGSAEFSSPLGIATDAAGNLYVTDTGNRRIRKIDLAGNVTTIAGNGMQGYADGASAIAEFDTPFGIAIDRAGNVYVADFIGLRVRMIDVGGTVTTVAGNGVGDTASSPLPPVPADSAAFVSPAGLAVDTLGNLYVADTNLCLIQQIAHGTVTTYAGGQAGFVDGTGGPFGTAEFAGPEGLAITASGVLYVADFSNNSVRMISPGP